MKEPCALYAKKLEELMKQFTNLICNSKNFTYLISYYLRRNLHAGSGYENNLKAKVRVHNSDVNTYKERCDERVVVMKIQLKVSNFNFLSQVKKIITI